MYLSLLFCSYFVVFVVIVVLCIFIFVCTSVGLLPPSESPIAVSNNNNNIFCVFVCVASVILHTKRMRGIIMFVGCLHHVFTYYLIQDTIFGKTLLNIECVFWFSLNLLSETLSWAFSQIREISFVISVCLSVRMEPLGSHWKGFDENWDFFEGATNDVTIWRMRVECWISKAICTYGHARTHRPISNTCCFYTARMVRWTRLTITLYVHCTSCSF